MTENRVKASSSAVGVAALRAAAAQERDPAVRNPDYLAIRLLPLGLRALAKVRPLVWLVLKQYHRVLPGGYYFHTARTKHIDTVLRQCIEQGMHQLVILGAGFDTRAYRFRDALAKIKVFEVDQPATQAMKKERVTKLKGNLPMNITYVPIDLDVQSLDTLLECGYSPQLRLYLSGRGSVCTSRRRQWTRFFGS